MFLPKISALKQFARNATKTLVFNKEQFKTSMYKFVTV